MLQKLQIQNYAIIDEITIAFPNHLSIITGETGAGKSILMGALGLILGERADSTVLLDRSKKCVVEGSFDTGSKKEILQFLQSNDLDADAELVIRREIGANGKSRAFINDTPVNLSQLQQLSSLLVDLHQQFDTLSLGETDFQREVIDALAAHADIIEKYQRTYHQFKSLTKELFDLQAQKDQFTKEYDYNKFLFDELEEAGLKENELEEAEAEIKLLTHSEGIKSALDKVSFELGNSDQPIVQRLKTLLNNLQSYADYHPALAAIIQRLQSAQVELKDITDEIESVSHNVQYDPRKIEQLNEKLSAGYKLLKKHGVQATNELLSIKDQLAQKLTAVLNIDEAILQKKKEVEQAGASALELAKKIAASRQKQTKPLEEKVNKLLGQVGMPNARLKVEIKSNLSDKEDNYFSSLQEYGIDSIEFLFDANKSNQFAPIRKVASGGELSRLMLCIKSLVARSIDLPTMIFDEIDTGISGEAARQVGIILKELSQQRQIICITHQPQIAGKADAHFYVYKQTESDAVRTNIRLLTQEERITAIAKMLSGEKPTVAAMENAREMVMN